MKTIRLENFNGIPGRYYTFTKKVPAFPVDHNVLYERDKSVFLFPDNCIFSINKQEEEALTLFYEGDVLQFDDRHTGFVIYSNSSNDNALVITMKCNSNCVMCPIPEQQRMMDSIASLESLLELSNCIPSNADHLTITGGEPFLLGKDMFALLSFLKKRFTSTNFLMLTNGRAFANVDFTQQYVKSHPIKMVTGIPIHGSNNEKHDSITQTPGSFKQTILGIKHLLHYHEKVEVRFVVSRLNENDITAMAQMIVDNVPDVDSVKVMGLEMLGGAAAHQDEVWIDYEEAFNKSKKGIDLLIKAGLNVELYNFPLCSISRNYWGIYQKSITDYKIRFLDECESCKEKGACGGVFAGTKRLMKGVKPFIDRE